MPKAERWTRIHLASLAVVFVGILVFARNPWFFDDEWDYLTRRRLSHPTALFAPHNEHWNTFPILIYRGLFAVFGVRTYWPYLLAVVALHLVAMHLLWRVMRNAGLPLAFATAAAFAFGFFGRGWENILWGVQITYMGSLVGGLLLLLAIDERGSRRRVVAVAVGGVLTLPWSGFSVVAIATVGLLALRRWDWRRAAIATVPAAAVYLAWLRWKGHTGLTLLDKYHGGPSDIPRYVIGGIGAALGAPVKNVRVGEALLVIVAVVTAVHLREWWRTKPDVLVLAAGAPVLMAVISQGRGVFLDPGQSRYLYMVAAMLLPLVALVAWTLARQRAAAVPVLTAVAVLIALGGAKELRHAGFVRTDLAQGTRRQFIAAVQLKEAGVGIINDNPDYLYDQALRIAPLVHLVHTKQFPTVPVGPYDIAKARLGMQLHESSGHGSTGLAGCTTVNGPKDVTVQFTAPGKFSLETRVDDTVFVFVPVENGLAGPRPIALAAHHPTAITTTIPALTLRLPADPVRLCGTSAI